MFIYCFLILISTVHGFERHIKYTRDPGCESFNFSLSYLRADGPNDSLHYLWDFTSRPNLFLALTNVNASLNVDCEAFANSDPQSFNFTEEPKYEFSLILSKVIEFNDVNDTGILTPQTPRVSYDTKYFTWDIVDPLKGDKDGKSVGLTMTGNRYNDSSHSLAGNITIQMTAFGFENHDSELPRLLHSPNSTQCKIVLDNLVSDSGFNESRFAVEMILLSGDRKNSSSKIILRKNLDDENSPGIFSMVDVMTPGAQDQKFRGAFLQWRPVTYVSRTASIENSTEVITYNLTEVTESEDVWETSLPFKYYGPDLFEYLSEQIVVSLGMAQDGFYKKTKYSSWTFLVNYGSPETEKFSLLVILVMCIGLGLPALLILVGGAYVCVKRLRRNKDELSFER